ncbi:SYF2 splicing factor-domain-containing protein [Kalaharituber pfeilii]|nr:SYF2 splicing factor-domain-containing protein [Kalaharituber pfeilii]
MGESSDGRIEGQGQEQPESGARIAKLSNTPEAEEHDEQDDEEAENHESSEPSANSRTLNPREQKAKEREERFRALRARAKTSASANLKEVFAERRRQALDPRELARLQRLRSEAEFKLAKSDVSAEGGDFERKRAWDWTVEEAEAWDKKLEKKKRHVEDVAFQDYTQAARKVYKKQLREMGPPDLKAYMKEKGKVIRDGQVFEVEDEETGEVSLVAVDREGEFYAGVDSLGFVDNKPPKAKIDKLVGDLKRAEETRNKRRGNKGDDEDVTYINDKNKQFNMKLARYYNKYTSEIRDSFERGTMI